VPSSSEARPALRVARALLFGVLAEVLTIITVGIVILGHRVIAGGQTDQQLQAFGLRAAAIVGPVFGALYTFVMAFLVVHRVRSRPLAHGLLVALGAIVVHLLGAFGAPGGFRAVYLVADCLKLIAGGLGGLLAQRK
jgi:hypothetical protein